MSHDITKAAIALRRSNLLEKMKQAGVDFYKSTAKPRMVCVAYRGAEVEVHCASLAEEFEVKTMAIVKPLLFRRISWRPCGARATLWRTTRRRPQTSARCRPCC